VKGQDGSSPASFDPDAAALRAIELKKATADRAG
jgi:hypothetical protein